MCVCVCVCKNISYFQPSFFLSVCLSVPNSTPLTTFKRPIKM